MILPTKHLDQDRALLTVGARILALLDQPKTVSATWEELSKSAHVQERKMKIRYDHFVLSLDLLYTIGVIEVNDGLLTRTRS